MGRILPFSFISIFSIIVVLQPFQAQAWQVTTHMSMTNEAVKENENFLQSIFTNEFGFDNGLDQQLGRTSVRQHIRFGSKSEDELLRPANHFHNPLVEPTCSAGLAGTSAICWILFPPLAQSLDSDDDFSWNDAREYMFTGFFTQEPKVREEALAKMFEALGHVMHLIQDTANPAHVRSDPHLDVPPLINDKDKFHFFMEGRSILDFLSNGPFTPDPSLLKREHKDTNLLKKINEPLANLVDSETYTKDDLNPSNTLIFNIGISEFSNANFFSDDTLPRQSTLPHPSVNDLEILGKGPYLSLIRNGTLFINRSVRVNRRSLLARRLFTSQAAIDAATRYSLDDMVFQDYAEKLIPRAVGYSAAALKYFFRGKMKPEGLVGSGTVRLRITNESEEPMEEGTFFVMADTVGNGVEARMELKAHQLSSPLAPGSFIDIPAFGLPNNPKTESNGKVRFFVVFRGKLGLEEGAVAVTNLLLPASGGGGEVTFSIQYWTSNQLSRKASPLVQGNPLPGTTDYLVLPAAPRYTGSFSMSSIAFGPSKANAFYSLTSQEFFSFGTSIGTQSNSFSFSWRGDPTNLCDPEDPAGCAPENDRLGVKLDTKGMFQRFDIPSFTECFNCDFILDDDADLTDSIFVIPPTLNIHDADPTGGYPGYFVKDDDGDWVIISPGVAISLGWVEKFPGGVPDDKVTSAGAGIIDGLVHRWSTSAWIPHTENPANGTTNFFRVTRAP